MVSIVAIIFGIISMIGFGLSNAISQIPSKKIGGKRTIFFRSFFITILFLIALPFFKEVSFSVKYIIITLGISLIGYVALISFYNALSKGKVGLVSPVANSAVIFTVIFSTIFFHESLAPVQWIAIFLIVSGIILTSLNLRSVRDSSLFKLSSGIPYALITCLLWGLVFFLFKIPVTILGPILTSLISEVGLMIFSGIDLRVSKTYFKIPDRKVLKLVFLVAFFGAIGLLFFNLGINQENSSVGVIAAISFANPLVAILYGKIVYKEKLNFQQWIAVFLILIGIVTISYF